MMPMRGFLTESGVAGRRVEPSNAVERTFKDRDVATPSSPRDMIRFPHRGFGQGNLAESGYKID